ncbi:MAG TPA: exodeoxyribonuclease III [Thermotogota bacterium]|nr:exodeoxyribonuclease III [Thermotogota bacterium]HRW92056.1 exodeoxyribonuclease III [Thermotogota bacterium]
MKILSWNVNGIRAAFKKGAFEWLFSQGFDVVCLQETKAHTEQLSGEILSPNGYVSSFHSAQRKGYSGVATFFRRNVPELQSGIGHDSYEGEGRLQRIDFGQWVLYNVYFPNGKASKERLQFKMGFYDKFLEKARGDVTAGLGVVVCGDFNTAHQEIDLARPKENEKTSGFLPEERQWMDQFVQAGFVDTFRLFCQEGGQYTWWDLKTRARERNVGWRIDYFFASESLRTHVKSASIFPEIQGSDHCPILLELDAPVEKNG